MTLGSDTLANNCPRRPAKRKRIANKEKGGSKNCTALYLQPYDLCPRKAEQQSSLVNAG